MMQTPPGFSTRKISANVRSGCCMYWTLTQHTTASKVLSFSAQADASVLKSRIKNLSSCLFLRNCSNTGLSATTHQGIHSNQACVIWHEGVASAAARLAHAWIAVQVPIDDKQGRASRCSILTMLTAGHAVRSSKLNTHC